MFVPNDMCVINEREIVALFYIQYIDSKAAEPCHVNMGRIVMFSNISLIFMVIMKKNIFLSVENDVIVSFNP